MEDEIVFKILLLGNSEVGKTSLIVRYCDDKFQDNLLSTIGMELKNKVIEKDNKKIILKIYDTAGQERYHSISKNYYNSSDGILLVYDVSDSKTFESIKGWIDNIKEVVDLSKIGLIIIGNKCDVDESSKQVTDLMRDDLEKSLNIKIYEASAKTNTNVNECFNLLIDQIYKLKFENKANKPAENFREGSLCLDKREKPVNKKNCC
jgi:small GTP-binding protein